MECGLTPSNLLGFSYLFVCFKGGIDSLCLIVVTVFAEFPEVMNPLHAPGHGARTKRLRVRKWKQTPYWALAPGIEAGSELVMGLLTCFSYLLASIMKFFDMYRVHCKEEDSRDDPLPCAGLRLLVAAYGSCGRSQYLLFGSLFCQLQRPLTTTLRSAKATHSMLN